MQRGTPPPHITGLMHSIKIDDQAGACRPLAVTYRPTASLRPDPRNARTHPRRQVEQIVASIRAFGFTNPVLVDREGVVIAGHGRLLAAKELGLVEVPTIELAGLSEAKRRALRLADNKIALNAGWDLGLLKTELGELSSFDLDFDVSVTGFSSGDIEVLLRAGEGPGEVAIPALPATPRTRPGDIWRLGQHVTGCGDSRDASFLRKVVGEDASIDAAFLDPPHSVGGHDNARGRSGVFGTASGEMERDDFRGFLQNTLGAAARVSRDGAVHFVCMELAAHGGSLRRRPRGLRGAVELCVWNKSRAEMGSLYRSNHELVFVFRVGTAPHLNGVEAGRRGRKRADVWDYASVETPAGKAREAMALHRTVKPMGLVADALLDVTRRGDLVLDFFSGLEPP